MRHHKKANGSGNTPEPFLVNRFTGVTNAQIEQLVNQYY
jgi:hypothetical protein